MICIENKSACIGCYVCASACPKGCISMVYDAEGFLYPQIEEKNCIHCGICEKKCPTTEPSAVQRTTEDFKAYAAYTKSEEIRLKSSSGGLFTEIAGYILKNGGVVFGAAFDDDFQVKHIAVENISDLDKLRRSKYVQSTIGTTYIDAKKYLDAGKTVLFSGTPCQIAGLYRFLNREYDSLITQDIICHGVPSPLVWKKYLDELGTVQDVNFREKSRGWKKFGISVKTDKKEIRESRYKNVMMEAFLKNMCLRPSCYECRFKGENIIGAFTLADFWGIEKTYPEMNDGKGTSLVIARTARAREIMEAIADNLVVQEVDYQTAVQHNSAFKKSVSLPPERELFMQDIWNNKFSDVTKKYCSEPLYVKLKRFIWNCIT